MERIDWDQVEEWERKYYLHVLSSNKEYEFTPVARVDGDYIEFADGSRVLDMLNQLICVPAGQCRPEIQKAISAALERYGHVAEYYSTDLRAKAAKLLLEGVLGDREWPGKVRFVSTGTEAVELALIVAKLWKNRPYVLTREFAYHGWTMGAAGATKLPGYAAQLSDPADEGSARFVQSHPPGGFFLAPNPDCFDCSLGHTYPACKETGPELPCIRRTRRVTEGVNPQMIAAMITEPICGSASIAPPPPEYFPQLRRLTREMDIAWICDEVMMGFAKTGHWFCHQAWGEEVEPDIVVMGKGLSNSAVPAAGIIVSKEIAGFLDEQRWINVSTFGGHPVAMAAVCATLEYLLENDAPARFRELGDYFAEGMKRLEKRHPTIGAVNHLGMVFTIELVKDPVTRERFIPMNRTALHAGDVSQYPTEIVLAKTIERGVVITGFSPNTLRISASMGISHQDLDKALDALDYALDHLDSLAIA